MSEEYSAEYEELNDDDANFENHLSDADAEYEEEEISTDEVDRVLDTLTNLLESVESSTVHEYLEEAYHHIFSLVYEEEGDEETTLEGLDGEETDKLEEEGDPDSEEFEEEGFKQDFGQDELLDDEAA
ncbi:MAG: hypothetical protein P8K78_07865 [Pirellulales bacterium]|nr:hypothetical protein [Pirellulales bacterium]